MLKACRQQSQVKLAMYTRELKAYNEGSDDILWYQMYALPARL